MANDRRGGEAEKRRAGRREKGEGWIPRSEEMKTKGGMDGMEITKRDEHLAHPSFRFRRSFASRTAKRENFGSDLYVRSLPSWQRPGLKILLQ